MGEKQVHEGYCLLAGQQAETQVPCMCLRVADSGIVPGIQFWGKIPAVAPILVPVLESSSSTDARQKKIHVCVLTITPTIGDLVCQFFLSRSCSQSSNVQEGSRAVNFVFFPSI